MSRPWVEDLDVPAGTPDGKVVMTESGLLVIGDLPAESAHVIQDEGTPLTQRADLDFQGAGVTVTDDAVNGKTVVTIPGGGGGGTVGTLTSAIRERTSGVITISSTTWVALDTGLDLVVAAATGDVVTLLMDAVSGNEAQFGRLSFGVVRSGPTVVGYRATMGGSTDFGVNAWLLVSGQFTPISGGPRYTVQAADVVGGNVTFRLIGRKDAGATNKTITAGGGSVFQWSAVVERAV